MPLLRMWWHWHNHLHRDEFKENVSQPAQQESSNILKHFNVRWNRRSCFVRELISHWRWYCRQGRGGGTVYRADVWIWTGTYGVAFPPLLTEMYSNEAPCWGVRCIKNNITNVGAAVFCSPVVSTERCCFPYYWNPLDFRGGVLLSSAMVPMLTWFGSLDAALLALCRRIALSLSVFLRGA